MTFLQSTGNISGQPTPLNRRLQQSGTSGSRQATLSMVYKLGISAEKHWRKLRGYQLITKVVQGSNSRMEKVKEAA